jgi:hypothetical protein
VRVRMRWWLHRCQVDQVFVLFFSFRPLLGLGLPLYTRPPIRCFVI